MQSKKIFVYKIIATLGKKQPAVKDGVDLFGMTEAKCYSCKRDKVITFEDGADIKEIIFKDITIKGFNTEGNEFGPDKACEVIESTYYAVDEETDKACVLANMDVTIGTKDIADNQEETPTIRGNCKDKEDKQTLTLNWKSEQKTMTLWFVKNGDKKVYIEQIDVSVKGDAESKSKLKLFWAADKKCFDCKRSTSIEVGKFKVDFTNVKIQGLVNKNTFNKVARYCPPANADYSVMKDKLACIMAEMDIKFNDKPVPKPSDTDIIVEVTGQCSTKAGETRNMKIEWTDTEKNYIHFDLKTDTDEIYVSTVKANINGFGGTKTGLQLFKAPIDKFYKCGEGEVSLNDDVNKNLTFKGITFQGKNDKLENEFSKENIICPAADIGFSLMDGDHACIMADMTITIKYDGDKEKIVPKVSSESGAISGKCGDDSEMTITWPDKPPTTVDNSITFKFKKEKENENEYFYVHTIEVSLTDIASKATNKPTIWDKLTHFKAPMGQSFQCTKEENNLGKNDKIEGVVFEDVKMQAFNKEGNTFGTDIDCDAIDDKDKSTNNNTVAIAVSVSVVGVVLIAAIGGYFVFRRYKNKQSQMSALP